MLTRMGNTRVYLKGVLDAEGFPIADVSDHLAREDTVVWVDVCDPTKAQLDELAEELGLHELAVEDALGPHQRPKLDHYASHKFLVCHAARFERASYALETTEIDAFVSERWLITVRKNDAFSMDPVKARWDRSPDLAVHGVSFLLYGLLDAVVDGYFTVVNGFDEFYDKVSEELFAEKPMTPSEQQVWFTTRQALMRFRRVVVPMREAISALMRREQGGAVDTDMYPYYQDVYDHILRVGESTDALRDLVGTLVETNLSLRDYRANQIMKLVTSWAAIIAVPTLITGWYGMNVPYPGSGETWGVWAAAGLVVALSAGLYVLFKRRNWL
jgi:magnesium transporter